MIRVVSFLVIILSLVNLSFPQTESAKSIEQLIQDLKSDNNELSESAFKKLSELGESSASILLPIVADRNENQFFRVKAINILREIKYRPAISTLINILDEENSFIKGNAAFALSQMGGARVENALFRFLENSFNKKDNESLPRALEAIKNKPDKRAFPILMKILEIAKKQNELPGNRDTEDDLVQDRSLIYAAEALGNIGDSRASVVLAKFLDPTVPYDRSRDYLYLRAICKTKGKKVIPYLISYLKAKTKSLKGKESPTSSIGAGNRQIISDLWRYSTTVECLEKITKQKSIGSTREDVYMFWEQYWEVHQASIQ